MATSNGNQITGTADNDIITPGFNSPGVTGGEPSEADDTIDALGGNDIVSGGGGADTIEGGGGNDVLLGGAGDDTLTDSDFGNDTLAGGQGNDTLEGGKGDDTLDGGTGDDTLDGGIGLDTLRGGADNDILLGGDAADLLQGDAGDDTLEGGEGNDTLEGGADDDTLSDSSGHNTFDGGAGNDTLTGGPGVDIYRFAGDNGADRITAFGFGGDVIDLSAYGLAGLDDFVIEQRDADTVIFGYDNPDNTNTGNTITLENVDPSRLGPEDFIFDANANVIVGTVNGDVIEPAGNSTGVTGSPPSDGPDVIKALAGDDTVTGAGGNDVLDGAGGNDTLDGGAGNDVLAGGNGVDTLNGGAGNDVLRGEGGADTLDGGAGDDRLEGGGSQQADVFVFAGANGADTITDFEDGFDRIDLTAYDVSSVSDFNIDPDDAGNTVISGYDGEGNTITLQNVTAANLSNDDFIFSAAPGAITGTAGDDIIIPGDVSDGVTGGEPSEADDTIDALGGNDIVSGGGGADTITGGADNDTLIGGAGNDVLDGGEGDDDLVGGQGNDTLIGGSDFDQFDGGAGADTADFSSFESSVFVDLLDTRRADGPDGDEPLSGIENIIGTEFDDAIEGDNNANTLRGNAGNDNIFGYAGSDFLDGGADADNLYGGDGNDILDGGTGPDLLSGEEGDDTFVFTGDNGRDRILFFDDLIDLRDYEEVSSIDDLTIRQVGSNTVISGYNGEGNIITLLDFDSGFLSSSGSDFLFGDDVKPPDVSIDPDPAGSLTAVQQDEGDSGTTSFFFTVTRSGSQPDLNQATSVNWAVKPGNESATQGAAALDDFVPGSDLSGVLEWEPGDDEAKTITVEVQGDTVFEQDEGFSVRLSKPQNATIVNRESVGTIVNDDPEPPANGNSIYISDVQIDEGNEGSTTDAVFEVSLSTPVAETVTVDFATEDGTATAGTDYTAVDGTLTFAPGETVQEVRVPILGDGTAEGDETFLVNLSNPVNDVIADGQGAGTIWDDDSTDAAETFNAGNEEPVFSISQPEVKKDEGDSGTTDYAFTVTREGDLSGASSVFVNFNQGDTDSNDFGGDLPDPTLLLFEPDEDEQTVTYSVSGDRAVEDDETFTVSLEVAAGATINEAASSADGIIANDDASAPEDLNLFIGDNAPNTVIGTAGDDLILTLGGADSILGNLGNDTIDGGPDGDLINGGGGDDTIDGGGGGDLIDGGRDNDMLEGGAGNDTLEGGEGIDNLGGGSGNDLLSGAEGDDVLRGGSDNDVLEGGADDDTLSGGSGDDQLSGGTGNDTLIGGSDSDTFVFRAADGDAGQDTIHLFNADEDTLSFEDYGESLNAFSDLDTSGNGVLDEADDHVSVDAGDTVIDLGGQTDGESEGTLTLVGVTGLVADDMLFS